MKFETVRIYLLMNFRFVDIQKILLPWQRDVTTSPLHFKLANRKEAKTVRNVNADVPSVGLKSQETKPKTNSRRCKIAKIVRWQFKKMCL